MFVRENLRNNWCVEAWVYMEEDMFILKGKFFRLHYLGFQLILRGGPTYLVNCL